MLYKCVECGHEIARDSIRCPNCGTGDAGKRAIERWILIRKTEADPNWQERERHERDVKAQEERAAHLKHAALENLVMAFVPFVGIEVIWEGREDLRELASSPYEHQYLVARVAWLIAWGQVALILGVILFGLVQAFR